MCKKLKKNIKHFSCFYFRFDLVYLLIIRKTNLCLRNILLTAVWFFLYTFVQSYL